MKIILYGIIELGVFMYIKSLILKNYRNYNKLRLDLSPKVNVFIGDNAQGKTNILESIFYCSIGKSHRTNRDKELVSWGFPESYLSADICKKTLDKKIEIKIFKEGKKGININSIKANKLSDLIGIFNVVMFSPEDLKIVKEAPAFRRKFLDIELCKLSNKYYYNLVKYNKVLNEKNVILKSRNGNNNEIVDIYDSQLAKYGSEIIIQRYNYINKLNDYGKKIHNDLTSGKEVINFDYLCCIKKIDNCEQELVELLINNRKKDFEKGISSLGPHKDDFSIFINNIDTRIYGSQGQQRTSVLTIKFASLEIIKEDIGEYPVLLLDDVLSELDTNRQKYILNSISNIQTIITCTGIDEIKRYLKDEAILFYVKNGEVSQV